MLATKAKVKHETRHIHICILIGIYVCMYFFVWLTECKREYQCGKKVERNEHDKSQRTIEYKCENEIKYGMNCFTSRNVCNVIARAYIMLSFRKSYMDPNRYRTWDNTNETVLFLNETNFWIFCFSVYECVCSSFCL